MGLKLVQWKGEVMGLGRTSIYDLNKGMTFARCIQGHSGDQCHDLPGGGGHFEIPTFKIPSFSVATLKDF
jgi:hypothetical protein